LVRNGVGRQTHGYFIEPSAASAGLDHCAFTYASLDDLFATYARLRDIGIAPYWCINHVPTLSMYYQDPGGNQMTLQIDEFDTNEGVNEWMAQSDFMTARFSMYSPIRCSAFSVN